MYDKALCLALWKSSSATCNTEPVRTNCDKGTEMVPVTKEGLYRDPGRNIEVIMSEIRNEGSDNAHVNSSTEDVHDQTKITVLNSGDESRLSSLQNHSSRSPTPKPQKFDRDEYAKEAEEGTSKEVSSGTNAGEIFNHVATDSNNILMMIYLLHFAWTMPIEVNLK